MERTHYVAGFLLSADGEKVLLIRKARPAWQAGRLNGIGGHVEPGESSSDAMYREFWEETGIAPAAYDYWRHFATLKGPGYHVDFYVAYGGDLQDTLTRVELVHANGEPLQVVAVADLHMLNVIPNLRWLIPLALDRQLAQEVHTLWPVVVEEGSV